jgi:hypothetical protein
LRLAENTEFVLVDGSLDKLLVKLNNGSAIIEATGPDGIEQNIPIITGEQRLTINRAGIYRINASPGVTDVFVRKGRISYGGGDTSNILKSGKKITFTRASQLTAKLTKNDNDAFDDWSKERGKTLARANQRLSARALNGYLSLSQWGRTSMFGGWGLWTWSPFASCYTFLPFHYGWGSPYGSYYGLYAGFGGFYPDGTCCRTHVYTQPIIVSNPTYTGGSGSYPGGTSAGGNLGPSSGGSGSGPATVAPAPRISQPDPRSPDSGATFVHKVRDPNN